MPKYEIIAGTPTNHYHDRLRDQSVRCTVAIDGKEWAAYEGQTLQDVLNRHGIEIPHVCFHPQMGPIETCDTCMVEVDGGLARACATLFGESPSLSRAARNPIDRNSAS